MIYLIGALCYAELASTYPSEGGDYAYFRLSFARWVALAPCVFALLDCFFLPPRSPADYGSGNGALGLVMVFVLLTYGGWNEIAFASAEFRNVLRDMLRVCFGAFS